MSEEPQPTGSLADTDFYPVFHTKPVYTLQEVYAILTDSAQDLRLPQQRQRPPAEDQD